MKHLIDQLYCAVTLFLWERTDTLFHAGAHVDIPNLSPIDARNKYMIDDNKNISTETVDFFNPLKEDLITIGSQVVIRRSNYQKETTADPSAVDNH